MTLYSILTVWTKFPYSRVCCVIHWGTMVRASDERTTSGKRLLSLMMCCKLDVRPNCNMCLFLACLHLTCSVATSSFIPHPLIYQHKNTKKKSVSCNQFFMKACNGYIWLQLNTAILSQSCGKLNDIALKCTPYNYTGSPVNENIMQDRASERMAVIGGKKISLKNYVSYSTEFFIYRHFIFFINIPSVHLWIQTTGQTIIHYYCNL